jgi:hypothetical protein
LRGRYCTAMDDLMTWYCRVAGSSSPYIDSIGAGWGMLACAQDCTIGKWALCKWHHGRSCRLSIRCVTSDKRLWVQLALRNGNRAVAASSQHNPAGYQRAANCPAAILRGPLRVAANCSYCNRQTLSSIIAAYSYGTVASLLSCLEHRTPAS